MSRAPRWTKGEIKALCGHLDTYWLLSRPIGGRLPESTEAGAHVRRILSDPKARTEIVLVHIRNARATSADRYRQHCETIGNQLVRFTEYGHPDELVDRFIKFAREEDAANKKLEKLLHRVIDEGLPPEVVAYDPVKLV